MARIWTVRPEFWTSEQILERLIGREFDRDLSLKIDKIIKKLEWEANARH
jgi:hypothetical protein